jgi:hypothetical protein
VWLNAQLVQLAMLELVTATNAPTTSLLITRPKSARLQQMIVQMAPLPMMMATTVTTLARMKMLVSTSMHQKTTMARQLAASRHAQRDRHPATVERTKCALIVLKESMLITKHTSVWRHAQQDMLETQPPRNATSVRVIHRTLTMWRMNA